MIKSILVAMDDSEASRSALKVATQIGKSLKSYIKGLHVENVARLLEWQPVELMGAAVGFSSGMPIGKPTEEQVQIEKEFIEEDNRLEKVFREEVDKYKLNSSFLVKRGNVEEIIKEASKTVDLIVMGRSHIDGSHELGLTAEYLLRHTTKPVIVVPEGGKLGSPVIVGYDGSQSSERALSIGAQITSLLGAKAKVVSVADDIDTAQKPLDEAKEFLAPYEINSDYIVDFGYTKPWKAIMEQVKDFDAGLIVLGAFGENRFLEMIFGSTTKEVLKQATCPVLLIR